MNLSHRLAALLAVTAFTVSLPLGAQTLYKCGKSFQDRPCDSAVQGKAIGVASSTSPSQIKPQGDIGCVHRGDRAKKIMWAREVGKTKDDQLATSPSQSDRDLIEEIYRMRGTSGEVSAAIEAKCEERLATMSPVSAPAPEMRQASAPVPVPPVSYVEEAAAAASKKNRCDSLAASLKYVQEAERAGGSARHMDSLRTQRRDVETRQRDAGC